MISRVQSIEDCTEILGRRTLSRIEQIFDIQFIQFVDQFQRELDLNLWLIGGWLRETAFDNPYQGDVDFIIDEYTSEHLAKRLEDSSFNYKQTDLGGFKIYASSKQEFGG